VRKTEKGIISEVSLILKSKKFRSLRNAFKKGKQKSVSIFGRTISVEPEFSYSGMTLFGVTGFVLGKSAF